MDKVVFFITLRVEWFRVQGWGWGWGFGVGGFGNRESRKASTFAMAMITATMITTATSH